MGLYSNDSSCSSTGATIGSTGYTPVKSNSPALAAISSPAPVATLHAPTRTLTSISSAAGATSHGVLVGHLLDFLIIFTHNKNIKYSFISILTQSIESLNDHISKIISQNEAILEVEPVLQKKYHKIRSLSRGNSLNSMSDSLPPMSSSGGRASTTSSTSTSVTVVDDTAASVSRAPSRSDSTSSKSEVATTSSGSARKTLPTLQQQAEMVLQQNHIDLTRKRTASTASSISSTSTTTPLHIDTSTPQENLHPQNPERSIIKSLLLNSRGLAVPTTGEGEDAVYTCPLCNIKFRSADNLQYHTKCYCQGTPAAQQQSADSPHSAPISPVGSPSHKYLRSNSFNLCLPEKYSPNTLAKLASSSLRHPHRTPLSLAKLAAQQANPHLKTSTASASCATSSSTSAPSTSGSGRLRPENIVINTSTCPAPTPLSLPSTSATMSVSSQCEQITKRLIDAALPSPGPLLGKTRLVDTYTNGIGSSEASTSDGPQLGYTQSLSPSSAITITSLPGSITTNSDGSSLSKRPRLNNYPSTSLTMPFVTPTASSASTSSCSSVFGSSSSALKDANANRLQMCGGGIKIIPKVEENQPRFGRSGGSIITISPNTEQNAEPSPLSIRTGLNSGGSIIETPSKPLVSPTPSDLSVKSSISSAIASSGIRSNAMNIFQFPPPINPITAYNPLTLPPVTAGSLTPSEPTQIYHGGKFIPYVQGMPGPNTPAQIAPALPLFHGEFQMPHHLIATTRRRSPSPTRKKIVPSSPIAVRATLSPSSRFSGYAGRGPFASPQGPSAKGLSRLSSPATPSEDDLYRSTPSAFTGVFQSHALAVSAKSSAAEPPAAGSKKTFNFSRIADNLSPMKPIARASSKNDAGEVRHFNFENLIPKAEIMTRPIQDTNTSATSPLHIDVVSSSATQSPPSSGERTVPTLVVSTPTAKKENGDDAQLKPPTTTAPSTRFLRPNSLPLKPGTYTPKMHHGITPTANTLPLISPETPRPSKNCVQLYLNGHAYTYLGLKCSTKPFYCTLNRPQPSHFTSQSKLSIYSNWQVCAENNPHPLGLSPKKAMSLYDSRQRLHQWRRLGKFSVAPHDNTCTTLQSKIIVSTPLVRRYADIHPSESEAAKQQMHLSTDFVPFDVAIKTEVKPKIEDLSSGNSNSSDDMPPEKIAKITPKQEPNLSGGEEPKVSDDSASNVSASTASTATSCGAGGINVMPPAVPGGYESNEDYTYVRGRGRGRYVCSECGIRCKKPSMLKKHIRTHSDVRPYTCTNCDFRYLSFN